MTVFVDTACVYSLPYQLCLHQKIVCMRWQMVHCVAGTMGRNSDSKSQPSLSILWVYTQTWAYNQVGSSIV